MAGRRKARFTVFLALAFTAAYALTTARALAEGGFPAGTYSAGMFTATYTADGKYQVKTDGETVVEGRYVVDKGQITVTDQGGRFACTDSPNGKYLWKFDGKAITFTAVQDECEGRRSGLTSQPWVKQ